MARNRLALQRGADRSERVALIRLCSVALQRRTAAALTVAQQSATIAATEVAVGWLRRRNNDAVEQGDEADEARGGTGKRTAVPPRAFRRFAAVRTASQLIPGVGRTVRRWESCVSNRIQRVVVLLALSACCSSCFFESPLDLKAEVPIDTGILGTWRCLGDERADAKPANFVVSRATDYQYTILFQEEGEDTETYEAYASVIRGLTLLNVRVPSVPKPWAIARYTLLRPNVVHVQLANDDKLKAADSTPASLRRALERALGNTDVFEDYCVCIRVKGSLSSESRGRPTKS